MKKRSRVSAFRHFGVEPKNQNWSRSAKSADGKTVVVTLWQDRMKFAEGRSIYEHTPDDGWFESPGQIELKENLIWCQEQCGGRFKVVLVTAKDIHSLPREVASSDPVDRYEMELLSLDRANGAFSAQAVPAPKR